MPVLRLPLLPAEAGKQHWGNLPGAALSLAIAEAASAAKRFTLLLTADSQSAERLEQELSFFAPDLPVLHFPDWETLPYDLFSPHQDIISQRIASLYRLPELAHGVLVVPITTNELHEIGHQPRDQRVSKCCRSWPQHAANLQREEAHAG